MQIDWIQDAILVLTFIVLYFYTAETAALRRETVRQTRVSLRPVVVPIFEREGTTWKLMMENIGSGSAFNIRIKPHLTGTGTLDIEYRFLGIDYLSPQDQAEILYEQFMGGEHIQSELRKHTFFPLFATKPHTLIILFDDVEGHGYSLPVTVTPSDHPGSRTGGIKLGAITSPAARDRGKFRKFIDRIFQWYPGES